MKAVVIYYSQTGNKKQIAEAICFGASSVCETDLVYISKINYQTLKDYDVIGIGTPVWCEREPVNVRKLIENITDIEGKYSFVFCTHTTGERLY